MSKPVTPEVRMMVYKALGLLGTMNAETVNCVSQALEEHRILVEGLQKALGTTLDDGETLVQRVMHDVRNLRSLTKETVDDAMEVHGHRPEVEDCADCDGDCESCEFAEPRPSYPEEPWERILQHTLQLVAEKGSVPCEQWGAYVTRIMDDMMEKVAPKDNPNGKEEK